MRRETQRKKKLLNSVHLSEGLCVSLCPHKKRNDKYLLEDDFLLGEQVSAGGAVGGSIGTRGFARFGSEGCLTGSVIVEPEL